MKITILTCGSRGDVQPFVPLAGNPEDLNQSLNDAGNNPIRIIRGMMVYVVGIAANVLLQVHDACRDADLINYTFLHAFGAHTLAREKKSPTFTFKHFPCLCPQGIIPTLPSPT